VFAAEAVLPRVGYARSAAAWSCQMAEAEPAAATSLDSVPIVPDD
jgi:hypothetical protein